jgi:long-subunit fatty acid transport protein
MLRPPIAARPSTALALALTVSLFGPAAPARAQAPSLDAFGLVVAEQSRPSFSILGAGARAAGMGGAFTALADDASAASFNPAGLALLVRPEASLVLDGRSRSDDHAGFANLEDGAVELYDPSSTSFDTAGLNFVSATWPVTANGRTLTFQLSYHRLIDFTFEGERNITERTGGGEPLGVIDQRIDQDGDVYTLSLAAAYQLTQRMSLGLTVARWDGAWSFSSLTREEPIGAAGESLRYRQDNEWSGWNVTGGVLLRYRYLNVGVSLRSPFTGDFRVDSRLDTSFESPFEPSSRFDGELRWPASYTVGLAVKPLETWVVTTDYSEFDWDDMEVTGLEGGPVNFFDLKSEEETEARHGGTWRIGTEYTVFPGSDVLALRAGWFSEPRPVPRAPGDAKSAVRGGTLGIGWKRGPVSVDVAWQRTSSTLARLELVDPDTVATGRPEAQAVGEVDVDEDRVFLSLLYQFDSRAAVRRLFHFLFVGPNEPAGEPGDGDAGD